MRAGSRKRFISGLATPHVDKEVARRTRLQEAFAALVVQLSGRADLCDASVGGHASNRSIGARRPRQTVISAIKVVDVGSVVVVRSD